MIWLAFAILTAFFESLKDVLSKKSLRQLDEYVVASASSLLTVVFLFPILLAIGIPPLGDQFWLALTIGGSLNVISFSLYIKALNASDLSLTVPLVTLTPLFLLVTSPLIVQEFPSFIDAIGVVFIVLGSYVLNLRQQSKGYLTPLMAIVRDRGSRLMLIVAFIWSITSTFDKIGVLNSSPIFWVASLFTVIGLGILPLALYQSRNRLDQIRPHWRILVTIGACNALGVSCQMIALTLTLVTKVIAVKRTSALMGVLFGHLWLGETGFLNRLTGAAIMVAGVVVISLL